MSFDMHHFTHLAYICNRVTRHGCLIRQLKAAPPGSAVYTTLDCLYIDQMAPWYSTLLQLSDRDHELYHDLLKDVTRRSIFV